MGRDSAGRHGSEGARKLEYDAIVFDMDGVILDSMPFHLEAWRRALRDVGIEVSELDVYLREGMKWGQTIAELSQKYGVPVPSSAADEIYDAKRRIFHEIFSARFFPGVRQGLNDLISLGYRLGLVTGSTRDVVDRVLDTHPDAVFEAIVTSDLIEHGKPSPEPYTTAVRMLDTEPQRCLAVENSPSGITSAKTAGLTCYAVTTSLPEKYLSGADRIFSRPHEVFDLLTGSSAGESKKNESAASGETQAGDR